MSENNLSAIWKRIGLRYKSHPWHGVEIGDQAPEIITTFIEVVPTDTVKYEIDKATGYLKIDRPQKYSNYIPALYGFLPQTYCHEQVAEYCREKTGIKEIIGDKDPLDICVLTERAITHGNILVKARPIGGFRMIDCGEADDKIIATLDGDAVYKDWKDITDCPPSIINRLKHYFLTYKDMPGQKSKDNIVIDSVYGKDEALEVISRSQNDYKLKYGQLDKALSVAALQAMNHGLNNQLDG